MTPHSPDPISPARAAEAETLVDRVRTWAEQAPAVHAVAVVGSYAYGAPRPDSDIDFILICDDHARLCDDPTIPAAIAPGATLVREARWGELIERRLQLDTGLLIELGFVAPTWLTIPLDAGTRNVLNDGCRIVTDKGGLAAAVRAAGSTPVPWTTALPGKPTEGL